MSPSWHPAGSIRIGEAARPGPPGPDGNPPRPLTPPRTTRCGPIPTRASSLTRRNVPLGSNLEAEMDPPQPTGPPSSPFWHPARGARISEAEHPGPPGPGAYGDQSLSHPAQAPVEDSTCLLCLDSVLPPNLHIDLCCMRRRHRSCWREEACSSPGARCGLCRAPLQWWTVTWGEVDPLRDPVGFLSVWAEYTRMRPRVPRGRP